MSKAAHSQPDWRTLALQWLGREPISSDGLLAQTVDAVVATLATDGFIVPPALRELHLRLGACAALMSGFNRFLSPAEWEVQDGLLMFLDENQGVCQWVVDAGEQVWMWVNGERHPENLALDDFLGVVLPYQLAQGGWPCAAHMTLPATELLAERKQIAAALGWPLIVSHNGLTIYNQGTRMLWSLDPDPNDTDASLFVSCLHQGDLDDLCERFGFVDLG